MTKIKIFVERYRIELVERFEFARKRYRTTIVATVIVIRRIVLLYSS